MPTILQVEDNYANKVLIERVLAPYGYQMLHATTGAATLTLAKTHKPDLILLDLELPDMESGEVVNHLRRIEALAGVPIVAITAWPPHAAAAWAQQWGCEGYFCKPINVQTFPEQIAAYLKQSMDNS